MDTTMEDITVTPGLENEPLELLQTNSLLTNIQTSNNACYVPPPTKFIDGWPLIGTTLFNLKQGGVLCDVKLIASDFAHQNIFISAHSIILSAGCSFFYSLFVVNAPLPPDQAYQVNYVDTKTLQIIVDFFYGVAPLHKVDLELLRKGANSLGISYAVEYVDNAISDATNSNVNSADVRDGTEANELNGKQRRIPVVSEPELSTGRVEKCALSVNLIANKSQNVISKNIKNNSACFICDNYFDTYELFVVHMWNEHLICTKNGQTKLHCHNCQKDCVGEDAFLRHKCKRTNAKALLPTPGNDSVSVLMDCSDDDDDDTGKLSLEFKDPHDPFNYKKNGLDPNRCHVCHKYIYRTFDLGQHLWSQHKLYTKFIQVQPDDSGMYNCLFCEKSYKCTKSFWIHRKTHLPETVDDRCRSCDDLCEEHFKYLLHLYKDHANEPFYVCCICGKGFKQQYIASKHINQYHGIKATYPQMRGLKLLITPLNFKSITPLYTALDNSTVNDLTPWASSWLIQNFYCPYCNVDFGSVLELLNDMKYHLKADKDKLSLLDQCKYECHICGMTFNTNQKLFQHKVAAHEQRFSCILCRKRFNTNDELSAHKANEHSSKKSFDCQLCNKSFSSRVSLKEHVITHDESRARDFVCTRCDKGFHTKTLYNYHMRKTHQYFTSKHKSSENSKNYDSREISNLPSDIYDGSTSEDDDVNPVRDVENRNDKEEIKPNNEIVTNIIHTCQTCGCVCTSNEELQQHVQIHSIMPGYDCQTCGRVCKNEKQFNEHMKTHASSILCHCQTCGKMCRSRKLLRLHMKHHKRELSVTQQESKRNVSNPCGKINVYDDPFDYKKNGFDPNRCHVCYKYYYNTFQMGQHLHTDHQIHTKFISVQPSADGMYHCLLCPRVIKCKKLYWVHRKQHLPSDEDCRTCESVSKQPYEHLKHLNVDHVNDSYFICCICGFKCSHSSVTVRHMKSHKIDATYPELRGLKVVITPLNIKFIPPLYASIQNNSSVELKHWGSDWLVKHYYCPHCNMNFSSMDDLINDIKNHLVTEQIMLANLNQDKYECHICGYTFKINNLLFKHRTKVHEKRHSCSVCFQRFNDSGELTMHTEEVHGDGVFICDICQKSYKTRRSLSTHRLTHEENRPRNYVCHTCGSAFYDERTLKNHAQIHNPQRTRDYTCTSCGRRFFKKIGLILHELSHTNVRPFLCTVCGKTFKHKSLLKNHSIRHGPPKYACGRCGHLSRTRDSMRDHEITHTSSRDHSCPICNNTYKRRKAVVLHLKSAHKDCDWRQFLRPKGYNS